MLLRTFILHGPEQAKSLHAFLKANAAPLAEKGKPLAVTVAEHKAKRSVEQNARHWAVLRHIAENGWVGGKRFSPEAWHAHFCGQFIGQEETPGGGWTPISSTTLSVAQFAEFMTRIEQFAAEELGLPLL
jgi:NinB protein